MVTDVISALNQEHEYVRDFGSFIVAVDKVGGGTVGRGYTGDWEVHLYDNRGIKQEVIPVGSGMPKLHQFVAEMVYQDIAGEW